MTPRSYCSDFGVVRACLAEIPLYSFDLLFPRLTMRTPLGLSRPPVLCIRGSSAEEPNLWQTGEGSGRPAIVVDRVPLAGPPSPSGKGKSKVGEIRYPLTSSPLVFMFGAPIFSLLTLSKCRRWFASLRRSSRTVRLEKIPIF